MATESIFTNINITDPKEAETFINALEEAEKNAEKFEYNIDEKKPSQEDIYEILKKQQKNE